MYREFIVPNCARTSYIASYTCSSVYLTIDKAMSHSALCGYHDYKSGSPMLGNQSLLANISSVSVTVQSLRTMLYRCIAYTHNIKDPASYNEHANERARGGTWSKRPNWCKLTDSFWNPRRKCSHGLRSSRLRTAIACLPWWLLRSYTLRVQMLENLGWPLLKFPLLEWRGAEWISLYIILVTHLRPTQKKTNA